MSFSNHSVGEAQQPCQQVPLVACQPVVVSGRRSARSDRFSLSRDDWDEGKGWGSGDVVIDDPVEGLSTGGGMEIDPPVTDLSGDDSTDSEYANVDDGGAMMVEDSEDERENMALPPPPIIQVATPHPAPVLRELIPIEDPAPLYPGVELEGEDNVWYIPLTMRLSGTIALFTHFSLFFLYFAL